MKKSLLIRLLFICNIFSGINTVLYSKKVHILINLLFVICMSLIVLMLFLKSSQRDRLADMFFDITVRPSAGSKSEPKNTVRQK